MHYSTTKSNLSIPYVKRWSPPLAVTPSVDLLRHNEQLENTIFISIRAHLYWAGDLNDLRKQAEAGKKQPFPSI